MAKDRLAEATNGKHHWDDPGMDDFEKGWEEFLLGTRVEVKTDEDTWRKGTVVETLEQNDRGIAVKCDEKYHDDMSYYEGRGATVMIIHNSRRGILSILRRIDEAPREVQLPIRTPIELTGNTARLLKIVETAVEHSEGRLRISFDSGRFLELDGKRLGRDIEQYGFMAEIMGWQALLAMFLQEILLTIKEELPKSYAAASEQLCIFGDEIHPKELIQSWHDLF